MIHPFKRWLFADLEVKRHSRAAPAAETIQGLRVPSFPLQNESHGIRRRQFLDPYLQLSFSIVLTAAAQIVLKIGADIRLGTPGYGFLVSPWIWTGISAILLSLYSWLYALKSVPLIVAFNLAATNHILVAIGAWAFLGEKITQQRWIGICLVALGAFFIARPASRAEEKL